MKKFSITQLANKFGLSRSTLLHYDSIGLLQAKIRTAKNYRVYTECEYNKLKKICSLRQTGISLENIRKIIDSDKKPTSSILKERLDKINKEIKILREQQNLIVKLLNNKKLLKSSRIITKSAWVNLLKSAGLDETGMHNWHKKFEQSMPEAHQDFLESLNLSDKEIKNIRDWSKDK